jgi:hypothetical protein
MPAIGLLLLVAQALCAVHAGRTGRPFFWIYLIIFVPMLGMVVYLLAEVAPELVNSRPARRAAGGVAIALDPGKGIREAARRVEITPTTDNKITLAGEYLRAGRTDEAIDYGPRHQYREQREWYDIAKRQLAA